ncbi:transporter, putative [Trypanosoma brucei gambiense DAL972]|uniref:Transporter, putative n=1 Tax=Trypanosoma brucei gambiense (strain MHOM/CI/86/DAL972) TaxID=679716 RepID=C9ZZ72_TRYB9|nr:transporter, putative [Trypanosoma brucei gambiense DAL972]CBH14721.1 transporter, putative [Trypanosoma brucei gambiense DAL972]|eukprot:XP_011776987.1 transporter, putative [Trypanosoma brucei gambiense DAL972]
MQQKSDAVTPLPLKQMFPLALVLLNESLCSSILLPYVGYLVSFFEKCPPEEAGYMSGVVLGSFMLGQFTSGKMWGWMSDYYGRKPTLALGLIIGGLMVLCFGFSGNIWVCIIFRFFHGLSNGNLLVAKTVLADILDRTNEAQGFAMVSFTYGFGILIGPAMGGLLYDPANSNMFRWAGFRKDGVFARYPGLMPAVACFFYAIFALVICLVFLAETNPHARPLPGWILALLPSSLRLRATHEVVPNNENIEAVVVEPEPDYFFNGLPDESDILGENHGTATWEKSQQLSFRKDGTNEEAKQHKEAAPNGTNGRVDSHLEVDREASAPALRGAGDEISVATSQEKEPFGYRDSFVNPNTRCVLVTYMLICCGDVAFSEIFSLWAIAGTSHGGLGYQASAVGTLLLTNSFPCLLSNVTLHLACRVITNKLVLWRISVMIISVVVGLMPFVTYAVGGAQIPLLLMCTFARQWFSSWAFGLITIFTARVAPPLHTGTMYGIAQSCGSIVRCVIPFAITPLFAWSISGHKPIPFNSVLTFLISSVMFISACVGSLGLKVEDENELQNEQQLETNYVVVMDCEFDDEDARGGIFTGIKG